MLMQIGVGLDARLGLSFEQHREMAGAAARLGYQSLWSPASAAGVDYQGAGVSLHGVGLGFKPPRVPVYLAALGPMMLRLAGELADGVTPNWSTPEQIAWCRQRVAEGARRAGRDPAEIPFAQYIRV